MQTPAKRNTFGLVLFAALFTVAAALASSDGSSRGRNSLNQLTFLGRVDGREYYLEASLRKNWIDARAHCRSFNMSLASVETLHQTEFLVKAFREVGHLNAPNTTWTSGRYFPQPTDFIWDNTWEHPTSEVLGNWRGTSYPFENYLCIRFYVEAEANNYFDYIAATCATTLTFLCSPPPM